MRATNGSDDSRRGSAIKEATEAARRRRVCRILVAMLEGGEGVAEVAGGRRVMRRMRNREIGWHVMWRMRNREIRLRAEIGWE